jgi:hypothetical protein
MSINATYIYLSVRPLESKEVIYIGVYPLCYSADAVVTQSSHTEFLCNIFPYEDSLCCSAVRVAKVNIYTQD